MTGWTSGRWIEKTDKEYLRELKESLRHLSSKITEDPLGIVWAGPEPAKAWRLRIGASNRQLQFGRLAQIIALEEDGDALYYMAAFPLSESPLWPIRIDLAEEVRSRWEAAVRLSVGVGMDAALEATSFHFPRPGTSREEFLAGIENRQRERLEQHQDNEAPEYALAGRTSVNSVSEAVEEKLRWAATDRDLFASEELWAASLMWVSDELAGLVKAMERTLPDDYVPAFHDLGVMPSRAFVVFAGESIAANLWFCAAKETRIVLTPTTAGNNSLFAALQEPWRFGMRLGEASEYFRLFWAYVLLINEPLTWTRHEKMSRPTARRVQRAGREPSDVLVVTLRRPRQAEHVDDECVGRDWSHRWIVNPFWRNQWYPSEGRHKPKFIHAYVKGPADKPLVTKGRVFRVTR